jgi:hypothetical protein
MDDFHELPSNVAVLVPEETVASAGGPASDALISPAQQASFACMARFIFTFLTHIDTIVSSAGESILDDSGNLDAKKAMNFFGELEINDQFFERNDYFVGHSRTTYLSSLAGANIIIDRSGRSLGNPQYVLSPCMIAILDEVFKGALALLPAEEVDHWIKFITNYTVKICESDPQGRPYCPLVDFKQYNIFLRNRLNESVGTLRAAVFKTQQELKRLLIGRNQLFGMGTMQARQSVTEMVQEMENLLDNHLQPLRISYLQLKQNLEENYILISNTLSTVRNLEDRLGLTEYIDYFSETALHFHRTHSILSFLLDQWESQFLSQYSQGLWATRSELAAMEVLDRFANNVLGDVFGDPQGHRLFPCEQRLRFPPSDNQLETVQETLFGEPKLEEPALALDQIFETDFTETDDLFSRRCYDIAKAAVGPEEMINRLKRKIRPGVDIVPELAMESTALASEIAKQVASDAQEDLGPGRMELGLSVAARYLFLATLKTILRSSGDDASPGTKKWQWRVVPRKEGDFVWDIGTGLLYVPWSAIPGEFSSLVDRALNLAE